MCVTTTLSAGEFNRFGGATNDSTKHKQLFADPSPSAGHRVIIMDPHLTLTAPQRVWLSTGLRAIDHCVESICSLRPKPEGTQCALRGIGLLLPSLLRTKEDPGNLDARLKAQLGAAESMKPHVIHGVPVGKCRCAGWEGVFSAVLLIQIEGGSHGIGHQVGPYGVPHAGEPLIKL